MQIEQDKFRGMGKCSICVRTAAKEEVRGIRPILSDVNFIGEFVATQCANRQFRILGTILDQQDLNFVRHAVPLLSRPSFSFFFLFHLSRSLELLLFYSSCSRSIRA